MKFGEFLDSIAKKENNNLRMFLFNLFKLNPQLKKEFHTITNIKELKKLSKLITNENFDYEMRDLVWEFRTFAFFLVFFFLI